MKNKLMLGLWRFVFEVPPFLWERQVARGKRKFEQMHGVISDEQRRVHHCVVRELPYVGKPLAPDHVAGKLDLDVGEVIAGLEHLEKRVKLIVRNSEGHVTWAYPVTVDKACGSRKLILPEKWRIYIRVGIRMRESILEYISPCSAKIRPR
ncbi:MAG: hypothetical protein ABIJ56_08045 [Pseudomonadota bacterium]